MEKLFQFTSKWSNIDSGLKAGPGGIQMWGGLAGGGGGSSLYVSDCLIEIQITRTFCCLPNWFPLANFPYAIIINHHRYQKGFHILHLISRFRGFPSNFLGRIRHDISCCCQALQTLTPSPTSWHKSIIGPIQTPFTPASFVPSTCLFTIADFEPLRTPALGSPRPCLEEQRMRWRL